MADSRRAAYVPYPFVAIAGQDEAKLAVLLAAINPRIGGVLLTGPKGVGKTSIVRGAADVLPLRMRAGCAYGCATDGPQCAGCAAGTTPGRPRKARTEIVELPANAQVDDVVGTIDLRSALERGTLDFRPGLLASANGSLLYVDEINLLADAIVDVLLDTAAQGVVHVKRGQHAVTYPSRFSLIGTMNPEEGELRPQITDRIGLRVFVGALAGREERAEIYRRNAAFARDPHAFSAAYASRTRALRAKVARAVGLLPQATAGDDAVAAAIDAVSRLGIESHRAEFVALEAAQALAVLDGRTEATADDVRRVFPMAARLRRSRLRVQALSEHLAEDAAIAAALQPADGTASDPSTPADDAGGNQLFVSPELAERAHPRARPQQGREGQPVASDSLRGGRLDLPATIVDVRVAERAGRPPEPKERVDAAVPPRLTVFVVDASQSTAQSADAMQAAAAELLRPVYAERDRAALISCWGPSADIVVDESVGRNVELVASRLLELQPGETRALTPLPDALEKARRIGERFRRAHPTGQVEIAVFSDGRANVPLGGERELAGVLHAGGDARVIASQAAEQCRTVAARFAGRAGATFVNLDPLETSALMRELATISQGRYFPIGDIVARVG